MEDHYLNSVRELLASEALDTEGPHLITVDELRAAGVLDVPLAWRKSLGGERDRLEPLFDKLDPDDKQQQSLSSVPDSDASADELD